MNLTAGILLSIVLALLRWLASMNTPKAVRARILLKANEDMDKRIADAKKAAEHPDDSDTHFRD